MEARPQPPPCSLVTTPHSGTTPGTAPTPSWQEEALTQVGLWGLLGPQAGIVKSLPSPAPPAISVEPCDKDSGCPQASMPKPVDFLCGSPALCPAVSSPSCSMGSGGLPDPARPQWQVSVIGIHLSHPEGTEAAGLREWAELSGLTQLPLPHVHWRLPG